MTFTLPFRIENVKPKKLVGRHMKMSLANDRTAELWRSFMPRRREIKNSAGSDLYSMQVYSPPLNPSHFDLNTEFEKWAAIEVSDFEAIPEPMETYTLSGGLYAVFIHKGGPSIGQKSFQYIFGTWLPASGYTLDDREHFELLGGKYKNDDPSSEEEIWIPIRPKK